MVWYGIVVWRDMVFFSSESEEKMGCCDVCGDLMDSLKKCANCKKVFITFTRNSVILQTPSSPPHPSLPPPPSLLPSFTLSLPPSLLSLTQAFYCSVECQKLGWSVGNHRKLCKKWASERETEHSKRSDEGSGEGGGERGGEGGGEGGGGEKPNELQASPSTQN